MSEVTGAKPIGVLLMNTGTPKDPSVEEVKRYLKEFLSDDHIVPMNKMLWSLLLRVAILPARSKASAAKYAKLWDGEDFSYRRHHKALAKKLQEAYDQAKAQGQELPSVFVQLALTYSEPSLEQALRAFQREGCDTIVVLPLYPQTAFSTAQACLRALSRARKEMAEVFSYKPEIVAIGMYGDNPHYIKGLAEKLRAAGFGEQEGDRILYSFHSIPLRDVRRGDTYGEQIFETVDALSAELGLGDSDHTLGFQSRFDKNRQWLSPFTKDVLVELAPEAQKRRLFVICPNFAVDSLETTLEIREELNELYRQAQRDAGIAEPVDFIYVECYNDGDDHVEVIQSVLAPTLKQMHRRR